MNEPFLIACDNQVSKDFCKRFEKHGFAVVVYAGDRADEDWVFDAIGAGAEVIVSPDLDIPNMLDKYNVDVDWIDYQSHRKDRFEVTLKELVRIRKRRRQKDAN